MIRRWHWKDGWPPPEGPFVASARILDIPATLSAVIRGVPANCVAVAIRYGIGVSGRTIADCERAARHRGIRLLWVRRRAALIGTRS